jgi:hypothetical protein
VDWVASERVTIARSNDLLETLDGNTEATSRSITCAIKEAQLTLLRTRFRSIDFDLCVNAMHEQPRAEISDGAAQNRQAEAELNGESSERIVTNLSMHTHHERVSKVERRPV